MFNPMKTPTNKRNSAKSNIKKPGFTLFSFESKWVDAFDLRRILNISRTTQFDLEKNKKLLAVSKLGNKKYFDLVALDQYLESVKEYVDPSTVKKILKEAKKS